MNKTVLFRDRIRLLREERGWSIREAARRIGVDESYLRYLEAGRYLPPPERQRLIADAYGVPFDKLTDWLVGDRLTAQTGEKTPGVNWFMRSLGDLDERGQRQAIKTLLRKLEKRQERGEAWPDEFRIQREEQ